MIYIYNNNMKWISFSTNKKTKKTFILDRNDSVSLYFLTVYFNVLVRAQICCPGWHSDDVCITLVIRGWLQRTLRRPWCIQLCSGDGQCCFRRHFLSAKHQPHSNMLSAFRQSPQLSLWASHLYRRAAHTHTHVHTRTQWEYSRTLSRAGKRRPCLEWFQLCGANR